MNEQMIFLFFVIAAAAVTQSLYFWKAKKEIAYRKDERWQLIQNKANYAANFSNYILVLFAVIGNIFTLYLDFQMTFTFQRLSTYIILFIGLRNAIEFFALRYFDKQL